MRRSEWEVAIRRDGPTFPFRQTETAIGTIMNARENRLAPIKLEVSADGEFFSLAECCGRLCGLCP
jgi:hypothetical protein